MRYLAGVLYGLAAAHGAGLLLDALGTGVCVALGTVAFAFAVEGIVRAEGEKR
jgi:hypothetical protein